MEPAHLKSWCDFSDKLSDMFKAQSGSFQSKISIVLISLASFLSACTSGLNASNTAGSSDDGGATPTPTPTPTPPCFFTPTTNMTASAVIGQPDMFSSTANQGLGTPTAKTLGAPDGVSFANDQLFVADATNTRYLVYATVPTTDNADADMVVGQASFSATSLAVNSSTTGVGRNAVWTGSQLIVADGWNNRLLVYNSFPNSNGQAADYVIGQNDFTGNASGLTATTIASLYGGMSVHNDKLWLADNDNHRIISFDLPITMNGQTAVSVLGQPDFVTATATATAKDLNSPAKVTFYGNKMIVADRWNSRVLVFNSVPAANYIAADVVIGQADFVSSTANEGGSPTDQSLNQPHSVAVDQDGRLYVADTLNHRILVYNTIPTANHAHANMVIGQANFTSVSANAGGSASAQTMNRSTDVAFGQCSLIVGDQGNNRVLIFK